MGLLFVVLGYAAAALSGGVVALKVIAPQTKSKVDDKLLKKLTDASDALAVAVPLLHAVVGKNGNPVK